jgi:hypothetical protein
VNAPINARKELDSLFADGLDTAALVPLGEDPPDATAALPTVPPWTPGRVVVLEAPMAAWLKASRVSPVELSGY